MIGPKPKRVFLELPFFGDLVASKYTKSLESNIRKVFPSCEPIILRKCRSAPKRSLKDPRGEGETCGVIYQFSCSCRSTYVGRTSRPLSDRIGEHVPRWVRQGNKQPPRNGKIQSSITRHLIQCPTADVSQSNQYFKILFSDFSKRKAHILEALLIAKSSPDLCRYKRTAFIVSCCHGDCVFYRVFLAVILTCI